MLKLRDVLYPNICSADIKRTAITVHAYYRSTGFHEVEAPTFLDDLRIKVVRLSALCTGRLYPPEDILGTHFY